MQRRYFFIIVTLWHGHTFVIDFVVCHWPGKTTDLIECARDWNAMILVSRYVVGLYISERNCLIFKKITMDQVIEWLDFIDVFLTGFFLYFASANCDDQHCHICENPYPGACVKCVTDYTALNGVCEREYRIMCFKSYIYSRNIW